ncbi:acyl-CoA dehydrogenase family protein [Gordonia sp. NB41Y]|uniref:acyl-CoA dehydrogenase family protein n=1 Tax=Gordonia sp. NB41Y TaxID=875808 RepID=UPI0006B239C5|nr:acyl-CoA dehydrogenase family protein [Gordonia sp. NB41Y]EMP12615.2 acyl-CoA dehydrogenase [Gordonia sp. NB41Y]WLP90455.1 acyl-CoA dehydrogenase family protein [Gordonia sp. NB41Y]
MTVGFIGEARDSVDDRERGHIDTVIGLAEQFAKLAPDHDERAEINVANLDALHDAGLTAAVLPAAVGGEGLSYRAFGAIVRAIAQGDAATATIWAMHTGAGVGLAELTRDTLGSFFAEQFLAGRRFANALSEPATGNAFLNPQQDAQPADGGWTLSGAKRFVSGSEIADYLLVNARVDGAPAYFAVIPDDSVTFVPIWDTLGLRATRSQLVSFDDTLLAADKRGRVPGPTDFAAIPAALPAISLGIADAALAALIAHARGREIAGAPLSHQQWVQHAVADAEIKLTAAHALYDKALREADAHDPAFFPDLNRAKYLANKVAVEVAGLGVRIGGGTGFLKTSPIQRHHRDAQAGQLMAHSTEVLATIIGSDVLGVGAQER